MDKIRKYPSTNKAHASADDPSAPASSSKSLKNGKRVLKPCSERKANLKKQKIHKEKSEENDDEDEKIVLKNEIKELKKSMKELSEDMKKLREITKADLLEKKEEMIYTGCGYECKEAVDNKEDTIFVKGYEKSRGRDEIKSALSSIFGVYGKVTRVFVPRDCITSDLLGFALIDLKKKRTFLQDVRT